MNKKLDILFLIIISQFAIIIPMCFYIGKNNLWIPFSIITFAVSIFLTMKWLILLKSLKKKPPTIEEIEMYEMDKEPNYNQSICLEHDTRYQL